MSSFFTTFFRQQLFANQALMNTANIRLVFFRQAPSLAGSVSAWTGAKTKAELTALSGWTEVSGISGYPLTLSQAVSVRTGVAGKLGNSFVLFTRYPFTGISPVGIAAIGVEYVGTISGTVNPLIFVTNTPIGTVASNVYPKDALTANPDTGFPDATNQYLFSWATPPVGATTIDPVEGPLALDKGAPDFEPSNTLHMWLYPQRANMIANPNFEVDAAYWAPAATRVALASAEQTALKSAWAGQFVSETWYQSAAGSNEIYAPDTVPLSITGTSDLDVRIRLALDDWTPAAAAVLISKANIGVPPHQSWYLTINTNGTLTFNWFADGTTLLGYTNVTPVPVADKATIWLRVTLDVNNGASGRTITMYTSTDGTNWTQLGSPGVQAGTTSIYDSLAAVRIGSATNPIIGKVYQAEVRNGIGGTVVAAPNFTALKSTDLTYTDPQGNLWTLIGTAKFANAGPLAVESNIWETRLGTDDHELWTFQLMAKGTGKVKVGLVYWDADYRATGVDWGTETWQLQGNTWAHLAGVRFGPQAHTAMLRIETDGLNITIDKVLAERGALKEWPYFDGHEKYGAPDDYSWYGGSTLAGKSYSMWYSDRRAVMGRMFATPVVENSPGDVITDTEVMKAGMVYQWVPAGVVVIPHIDVLYPDDLRSAPPTRSATVLGYSPTDPNGVVNPWV